MCHGVITQGKNRMRQFRTSGSVRGAAREGGSYRDTFKTATLKSELRSGRIHRSVEKADGAYTLREQGEAYNAVPRGKSEPLSIQNNFLRYSVGCIVRSDPR